VSVGLFDEDGVVDGFVHVGVDFDIFHDHLYWFDALHLVEKRLISISDPFLMLLPSFSQLIGHFVAINV
jgi:hypothetical protein